MISISKNRHYFAYNTGFQAMLVKPENNSFLLEMGHFLSKFYNIKARFFAISSSLEYFFPFTFIELSIFNNLAKQHPHAKQSFSLRQCLIPICRNHFTNITSLSRISLEEAPIIILNSPSSTTVFNPLSNILSNSGVMLKENSLVSPALRCTR